MAQNDQRTTENLQLSDFCMKFNPFNQVVIFTFYSINKTPIPGNRNAMKGILIGCAICAITHFTAYYTLTNYATLIFAQTDTTLISPQLSTIVISIALCSGSMLSAYLADHFRHKVLMLVSLIGCVFGLLSIAFYHYLYLHGYQGLSSFRWVPVASMSFVIFVEAAGIMPISIVCCVENLPSKVQYIQVFEKFESILCVRFVNENILSFLDS